jgi:conserved oligomeric Golgi complex subunit 6
VLPYNSQALSSLSKTRNATLRGAFLGALTRGPPRPIELHAHDPLRYVGDMLAWVHQTIAAERELLEALFGLKDDGRMVGSVRAFVGLGLGVGVEEEWIAEMMDGAVAGICAPLKVWETCVPRWDVLMLLFCSTGKGSADGAVAGEQHCVVQDREPPPVLLVHDAPDHWRWHRPVQGDTGARHLDISPISIAADVLRRLTDVAYKVFMDAIEAQGRALLRVSLVRPNLPQLAGTLT